MRMDLVARAKVQVPASAPIEGPWLLPEGWRWIPLGELGEFWNGAAFKPIDWGESGIPIIRIQNLNDPDRMMNRTKRVVDARLLVRSGDILVSWSATLDTFLWKREPAWLNQHIFKVVPDQRFVEHRLMFFLLENEIENLKKTEHLHGSTMMHINRGPFLAHLVPLPPRAVQKLVVARIDELLTELEDGEAALTRARSDLPTWRKSLLKAAVTGELTADWRAANPPTETGADLLARILKDRRTCWLANPRNKGKRYAEPAGPQASSRPDLPGGWAWASLPQLGDFGRGKSKHRPRNDPRLYGGPYPFVQTGVVTSSLGRIRQFDQTYTDFGLAQSKLWPQGTLCITIAANIAKTGVLQFDACFPDSVVGLTCSNAVHPEYVELVMRTLQSGLEDDAPATAQKNINLETLEELGIPLPSSAEQLIIIKIFKEAEAAGDLLLDKEIDQASVTLRQSILAAAFRGDLVA